MYTFRGKQGIQGVQGEAGPEGPSGDAGLTTVAFDPQSVFTTSDITIFASAPASGTLTWWGQMSVQASQSNVTTIVPKIGGNGEPTLVSKAGTVVFSAITISGAATITAGQEFVLSVSVNTGSITINTGSITYNIS